MIFMMVQVPVFAEEQVKEAQETVEECYIRASAVKQQNCTQLFEDITFEKVIPFLPLAAYIVVSTNLPTPKFYILYQSIKLYH